MSGRRPSGRGSRGAAPSDLHSLTLSSAQIRRLIEALGGAAPEDSARLVDDSDRVAEEFG